MGFWKTSISKIFGIYEVNIVKIQNIKKLLLKKGVIIGAMLAAFLAADLVVLPNLLVPAPENVTGVNVKSMDYDSVVLAWDKSENCSEYCIYRKNDKGKFKRIATTGKTAFREDGLQTGKKYVYKVEGKNLMKHSEKTLEVKAMPVLENPEISGTTKNGKIEIKIKKVPGAKGYKLYREGREIENFTEDTAEKAISFTDKKAAENKKHTYTVCAYRDTYKTEMAEKLKLKLVPVSKMKAEITEEHVRVSWEDSEKYDKYKLYREDKLLTETGDTEYIMTAEKGDFTLKLIGYGKDGKSPEQVQKFKIEERAMDNESAIDAACKWGVEIANDDSFAYGEGKRAHRCGCYFCGTNAGKKGKGYEKTYCCNPFVHACYAHGAKDPAMLSACRKGGSVAMTKESYYRYGNWKCVDKPAEPDLKRGDVLVANPHMGPSSSNHVVLYLGDGQIVHAAHHGWGADTIKVSPLTKYSTKYDFVMRYTGTGSGTTLKITETTEEKHDKES